MDKKRIFTISIVVFAAITFAKGAKSGVFDDCKYNSIATTVNIFYVAGCEFTKPRWNNSGGGE